MNVTCEKSVFGVINGEAKATLSLEGVTPGQTVVAGWIGATASRALERAECDGVAMEALVQIASGPNAFLADVVALEDVQTSVGAVTFTLNAAGAGDVFVLALTPSVLLELLTALNMAAITHACAPSSGMAVPAGAFLLSIIVQDAGARLFIEAAGYEACPLVLSSNLFQTREVDMALPGERALAITNAPTDSQGVLLAYVAVDGPEPPDPSPGGGPVRIFNSPIFGG